MSDSPRGWKGRILAVDLGARRAELIELAETTYRTWVGGRGLALHFLSSAGALPYDDPRTPLVFMTGPLTGTAAPTSGRMDVTSRSPLTGTVGDASVGGMFATQLKRAGLDGIVFTGRSDTWVGLEIDDGAVSFSDARGLIGRPIGETTKLLSAKGSVATIGIAAENGVRFSNALFDGHFTAARGGLGLSFASKKLKYVTCRGTGEVEVADKGELAAAREEIFRLVAASSALSGESGLRNLGTPALYDLIDGRSMMPTDNFVATRFDGASSCNASSLHRAFAPKRAGCAGCSVLCKKRAQDGTPLPEYETLSHFTALVGNRDLTLVVRANALCDELGMDTISAASTLACHREISGEALSPERICELLSDIAHVKGLGAELALGSRAYAESRGKPEASISVKGLELPAYDPRGAYGMALAYAVSTRGGCHLRAYPIGHEILRKPVATDRFSFAGKARIVKIAEDKNAVIDSLTACKFLFFAATLEEYARAFFAVTGVATTSTELSRAGERICRKEREMNAAYGFSAADDDLPERFFTAEGTSGPGFDVPPIDRAEFLAARARYYKVRGLDEEGRPCGD